MNNCLITNSKIKELTRKLQGETDESVKGLVALWQKENNKTIEDYPTAKELNDFRIKLRKSKESNSITEMLEDAIVPEENSTKNKSSKSDTPVVTTLEEQAQVDLTFDPMVRRDRASLISRLLSSQIDEVLEEKKALIRKRLENTEDGQEVDDLINELENLNRKSVLNSTTPAVLFRRVFDLFKSYVDTSNEETIQAELDKINSTPGADKFSDEQKLTAAKKRAAYKKTEYQKIVDNFAALAEEASIEFGVNEGVEVGFDSIAVKEFNINEGTPNGEDAIGEQADALNKEETVKDGWMSNFRNISSHDSLSQEVRKVIRQIPRLDYRGKYDRDDLGFQRYLDADYVHATLIDKLKGMINSKDMIPLLQDLAKTKPWVKQIIKLLQEDETLFSQFYQDFRKDFVNYWIQKMKRMPDGTYKMQTIAINKPEGIYYLLDAWRDNYENGIILDDDSIYEKNGELNLDNAEKGLKLVSELTNKFNNLSTQERLELLDDPKVWSSVIKLINMVGIDANPSTLRLALTDIKEVEGITFTDPIMTLLPQLHVIFNGVIKGQVKSKTDEYGTETRGDLINTFGSAYNSIALMLAEVTDDAIESSVRENDKSYYSHVNPNYLGKLIKQLKNVSGDMNRFKEFISKEFEQYEWFFKDGEYRSAWVRLLVESDAMRKGLDHKIVLNFDKKEYSDWDDLDYTLVLINEYFSSPDSKSNTQWAWYHVPILSDSPSAEFIKFVKYTTGYEDILLDHFTDLLSQEYDRIMLVRERYNKRKNGDASIAVIDNFDMTDKKIGGAEFKFLPALNSIKYENGETFLERLGRLSKEENSEVLKNFIRTTLKEVMDEGFNDAYNKWVNMGLLDQVNGKFKYFKYRTEDALKSALREYYWNSKFATSQIIQLCTTDLAFYKNLEDFQKRFKEVHAPSLRLNVFATYKGERVGREWERTIYLKDDEIVSSSLDDITQVLDAKVKKGELTKMDRDSIIHEFEKVIVADAQAYRSISSYRAILVMSGQWTDDMERAYNNFKNGNWNIADFNIIWQTKKPYVYTQVNNDSGLEGHTGIKTPVQHKNSEFLLLAMHDLISGPLGKSSKLRAINEFMEKHNIDVVQFESTTKVGGQGKIDLNNVNSFEEVTQKLEEATGIADGVENDNVVHKISYEDYGIQTATPEHIIDVIQVVGTQIRKLITADISPDTIIEVNGMKMTKQEWLNLYNAIITENILESFAEVDEIFKDPKEVERVLLEEIKGNKRYGIDMLRACTLDENGQFNIPLFDPVMSQQIQTLLNSVIKSRITKQRIKGGALIQVSNYGLTDDLHIVFEGEGDNKRIKYLEVLMPAYSREFYEPLMKPGTHELDINKLPDDLRKAIGYRVPTEDKYSMVPIFIKGFLPQQNGSAIMLPAEITTLSGSDFDVDKLYIMLPEFRVLNRYRIKDAWSDFYTDPTNSDIVDEINKNIGIAFEDYQERHPEDELDIDDYIEYVQSQGVKTYQFSEIAQDRFKKWFNKRKKQYSKGKGAGSKIVKVKYNHNKLPQENSKAARNNLMIDLMWGVLTNPDTAGKMLNPGGFNYQKRAARLIEVLNSNTEESLAKILGVRKNEVFEKLMQLDLTTLSTLASRTKKKLDPLAPTTQVQLHQQNMTGAKLIGIYANHNANHALIQHTDLALKESAAFTLNGKKLTSLHGIMNDEKEFISRNNAGYLAASVDNVKDPVLAGLNQNTFTADASMLISRLGYNPIVVGLLMSQPIVVDITKHYFRESRNGKGKDTVIEEIIQEYKKKASLMEDVTYDDYTNNLFLLKDLAENILIANEMGNITSANQTEDYRKIEFYRKQLAVGFLFQKIMNDAAALGDLVQATRSDTQGGAAGPTIADTIIKMQKVEDFTLKASNDSFPLAGAEDVIKDFTVTDVNTSRDYLLKRKLPFLQAFYSCGVAAAENMLRDYFPQYSPAFNYVIDMLRAKTKLGRLDVKTMNNIYNDLLAYIMSNISFFGNSVDSADNYVESIEKREYFINDFPEEFKKIVSENEDIASLEFIKRLRVVKANSNNPVSTIVFKNVGKLSTTLKERYMRDWASLLYMKNPEAQRLALNLFRYSYYRNGFAFGPSTFIHLAPTAVRKAIPEYIETLRIIKDLSEDPKAFDSFIDQYVYNHLDNRKLVPEIPEDSLTIFKDDNGDMKDEVVFNMDGKNNFSDNKAVKSKSREEGYDFFDYIARRDHGDFVYYRLSELLHDEYGIINGARYTRIEPLGFKNSFIEYEYDKPAADMSSVIKKKDSNNVKYQGSDDIAATEEYQPTEEDMMYLESTKEDYSAEALEQSYSYMYGESLSTYDISSEDDISSISPNTDFRDENNEEICNVIKTY